MALTEKEINEKLRSGECKLERRVIASKMLSFGEIFWTHLVVVHGGIWHLVTIDEPEVKNEP